jgi:hypothetical protein
MGLHHHNGNGGAFILPPTPKVIHGASLAHRHLNARQRAVLAADALDGLVRYVPTQNQTAAEFGVSVPYITAARRLSPDQRAAILQGSDSTSFAELIQPRQRRLKLLTPNLAITDDELVKAVRAVGVNRVLDAAVAAEAAE